MRRTINISVSEDVFQYIKSQSRYGSVSEYIRGLIRSERQRREDFAARPKAPLRRANDAFGTAEALEQLERLKAILEKRETYDD
jgi:Arc/MetJ-type ribon-helix-helix transcriptional regulator